LFVAQWRVARAPRHGLCADVDETDAPIKVNVQKWGKLQCNAPTANCISTWRLILKLDVSPPFQAGATGGDDGTSTRDDARFTYRFIPSLKGGKKP